MDNKKLNKISVIAQALFYWIVLNVLFNIWANVSDDDVSIKLYVFGYLFIVLYAVFKE